MKYLCYNITVTCALALVYRLIAFFPRWPQLTVGSMKPRAYQDSVSEDAVAALPSSIFSI
jgi:hypothetical protein